LNRNKSERRDLSLRPLKRQRKAKKRFISSPAKFLRNKNASKDEVYLIASSLQTL